jgi:hypothetical protein
MVPLLRLLIQADYCDDLSRNIRVNVRALAMWQHRVPVLVRDAACGIGPVRIHSGNISSRVLTICCTSCPQGRVPSVT